MHLSDAALMLPTTTLRSPTQPLPPAKEDNNVDTPRTADHRQAAAPTWQEIPTARAPTIARHRRAGAPKQQR